MDDRAEEPSAAESAKPKRVFLSYAWEEESYKLWVKRLATRLRADGVEARLDAWHLKGNDNVADFMNREVRRADWVLVICSPGYQKKVRATEDGERVAGVAWETRLLSSAVLIDNENKVLAVLGRGEWKSAAPDGIRGQNRYDLSDESSFETNYRLLLREITGTNEQAPPLGKLPANLEANPPAPLRGPDVAGATSHPHKPELEVSNDEAAEARQPPGVPPWFPIAGFILLAVTIVFLMSVILFRIQVDCDQRGIVVFIIALTAGGASTFLGGAAAARGYFPAFGKSVLSVALGGGIATVVVVTLIGFTRYVDTCSDDPRVQHPQYIAIGTPKPTTLQTLVDLVQKEQNVTVVFAASCGAEVPTAMIDTGTHSGNTVGEFLTALQQRARPPVRYRVTTSGANNERHEIVCF